MAENYGPVHCDYCHKSDVDVLHATVELPEWGCDDAGCVICDECMAREFPDRKAVTT